MRCAYVCDVVGIHLTLRNRVISRGWEIGARQMNEEPNHPPVGGAVIYGTLHIIGRSRYGSPDGALAHTFLVPHESMIRPAVVCIYVCVCIYLTCTESVANGQWDAKGITEGGGTGNWPARRKWRARQNGKDGRSGREGDGGARAPQ